MNNYMGRFWDNLSILNKFVLAFGLPVIIMVVAGSAVMIKTDHLNNRLNTHGSRGQLRLTQLSVIVNQVHKSSESLGLYLLSKDTEYKSQYINALGTAMRNISLLQGEGWDTLPASMQQKIKQLQQATVKLSSYKKQFLLYASDDNANFPALKFSSEHINPLSRKILQLISQMLISEDDEDVSTTRRALSNNMFDLRYGWNKIISEMRLYLAFRSPAALKNIQLYQDQVIKLRQRLLKKGDLLTFEESNALDELTAVEKSLLIICKNAGDSKFRSMALGCLSYSLAIHGGDDKYTGVSKKSDNSAALSAWSKRQSYQAVVKNQYHASCNYYFSCCAGNSALCLVAGEELFQTPCSGK